MAGLGLSLRYFRSIRGLTLEELASMAQTDKAVLSKLENAKVRDVGLMFLARVSKAMGFTVLDVLGHGQSPRRRKRVPTASLPRTTM